MKQPKRQNKKLQEYLKQIEKADAMTEAELKEFEKDIEIILKYKRLKNRK